MPPCECIHAFVHASVIMRVSMRVYPSVCVSTHACRLSRSLTSLADLETRELGLLRAALQVEQV